MSEVKGKLKYIANQIKIKVRNRTDSLEIEPIFILGNEKSGTTVIADLLAKACNYSVTLDIPPIWNPIQLDIHNNKRKLRDLIQKNKYYFGAKVIKEPVLTFEYPQLKSLYPRAKFILIVRDPRDNIRSILNRLSIAGNLTAFNLDNLLGKQKFKESWTTVIDNRWLGIEFTHYIESMASRWCHIVDLYLNNPDDILLMRYEDFTQNKVEYITNFAQRFESEIDKSFEKFVDIQYQVAGNKNVQYEEFFGQTNLEKILTICENRMNSLEYGV